MSLFVMGDLHLSLGCDKPMDIFRGWQDYMSRIEKNWRAVVSVEDTVVIPGDLSWGMSLEGAKEDFAFLHALPGKKLVCKGNHDYWWTTRAKMDRFLEENGFDSIRIVHNDAVPVGNITVCGTRGWFYDAEKDVDKKILRREVGRLTTSIEAAEAIGGEPVVFLHYPPVYMDAVCEEILQVLVEKKIRRCYYGHLHGATIHRATNGEAFGIQFALVSADSLQFCPVIVPESEKILKSI